jgi:hypothetical protein
LVCAQLVFTDGKVAVGVLLERFGMAARRKGDDHTFARKALTHAADGRRQITVARDEQGHVECVVKGVRHQLNGDVHVGHFLLVVGPGGLTGPAFAEFFKIVAELALHALRCQCFEVVVLPFLVSRVATVVADARAEVVRGHQLLPRLEQTARERRHVQPKMALEARLLHPKIEIEAVDVGNDAAHRRASRCLVCGAMMIEFLPLTPPEIASPARRPERGVSFCGFGSNPTADRICGPAPPMRRRFSWRVWTSITAMPPARRR